MKTIIVTRHAAAVEWLKAQNIEGEVISHLTDEMIDAMVYGDQIIGVLPINIAADICHRTGNPVGVLSMQVRPELRGKELTVKDMESCGITLQYYYVEKVNK